MANIGFKSDWKSILKLHELNVKPGDKLEFDRGAYHHVGIADGNDGVIHFSGEPTNKRGAHIRQDSIEEVVGQDTVRINNEYDNTNQFAGILHNSKTKFTPLPAGEIINRSQKAVGTGGGTYDAIKNNCEHFANMMRYDVKASFQVNETAETTGKYFLKRAAEDPW